MNSTLRAKPPRQPPAPGAQVLTRRQVAALLRPRPRDSHKGLFGTVCVTGGAAGMTGAALLAGRAALKLGAGCVHVCLLAADAPAVDPAQPELMLHPACDTLFLAAGCAPPGAPGGKQARQGAHLTLALGCGMGGSATAKKILRQALRQPLPLVLDADALNLLGQDTGLQKALRLRQHPSVITPHPGEAARLLGTDTGSVQADRIGSARQLADRLQCSVALKGAGTVCLTRDGRTYLNRSGNPGMSAPGMGDTLTGMIAAFIAQGLDADAAMLLAVHLHGAAGDALASRGIAVGMTAGELIDHARILLNRWLKR